MLSSQMFTVFKQLIDDIEREESASIYQAAEMTANSIAEGKKLYIYDRGHLLNYELFHRAGGLALLRPLSITWPNEDNGVEQGVLAMKAAVEQSSLQTGDVLILGSVSGRAATLVELAGQARAIGVKTIALTAVAYSKQTPSLHPDGKRLFEVCDYVLDIHTDIGDASLAIDGIEEKVIPTSGVTSAIAAWSYIAHLMEHLLDKGISPSVYRSVSLPNGMEQINGTNRRFEELGY